MNIQGFDQIIRDRGTRLANAIARVLNYTESGVPVESIAPALAEMEEARVELGLALAVLDCFGTTPDPGERLASLVEEVARFASARDAAETAENGLLGGNASRDPWHQFVSKGGCHGWGGRR